MTSIKSRAVAGKRSSSRAAKPAAGGTIRSGLLGSTALVAVGLAASGAMAQTYNPAGAVCQCDQLYPHDLFGERRRAHL